jgi:mRNA-degrading endonuclease RelE of RelBE toxin-antitoxin system
MKFTVVWLPTVEAALQELWLAAPDRTAVTDAANWIDRELLNNAHTKLTRVDDLYFLRREPLVILCDVNVDDRMVRVLDVHRVDAE